MVSVGNGTFSSHLWRRAGGKTLREEEVYRNEEKEIRKSSEMAHVFQGRRESQQDGCHEVYGERWRQQGGSVGEDIGLEHKCTHHKPQV